MEVKQGASLAEKTQALTAQLEQAALPHVEDSLAEATMVVCVDKLEAMKASDYCMLEGQLEACTLD